VAPPTKHKQQDKQATIAAYRQTRSIRETARQVDIPYTSTRRILEKAGVLDEKPTAPRPHERPQFEDLKTVDMPWRKVLDFCTEGEEIYRKTRGGQEKATVKIDSDRPIVICYSSDWHLGSASVSHDQWRRHVDTLLNTPNLYMIAVGDYVDNFLKFRSIMPVLEQIIPPRIQFDVLEKIFDEMIKNDKLLAASWGNHDDERMENEIGFSLVEKMLRNKVPYLGGQGLVTIETGDQKYSHLLTHKSRYQSFLNKLHGAKRMYQLVWPARIVVTAHTHNPDYETYFHYDTQNYLVKCGTFKDHDGYSARYWTQGRIGVPALVFYPDRDEIVPFLRVDQAVKYANAL